MKILKHGNTFKEFTCDKCDCVFEVSTLGRDSDIFHYAKRISRIDTEGVTHHVATAFPYYLCPECREKVYAGRKPNKRSKLGYFCIDERKDPKSFSVRVDNTEPQKDKTV
jgi:hypothetical protein